jgi:hypothetical protein
MQRKRLLIIGGLLALNILVSWMVLPFALPPFQGYSLTQLGEVFLWQAMGAVGWPFVLVAGLLSIPLGGEARVLVSLLLVLTYPAMLVLLVRLAASKFPRRWELPLLHLLITLSFTAIWYPVLNGYAFMVG